MGRNGWPHVDHWVSLADDIGPTLVGGSKKHGGADLGPTRAKQAWRKLGVNALSLADETPGPDSPHPDLELPRLTVPMVARLQGWDEAWGWRLAGRKTVVLATRTAAVDRRGADVIPPLSTRMCEPSTA